MAVEHWIITLRRVTRRRQSSGRYREEVDADSFDVMPTFRVARFKPRPAGEKIADEDVDDLVTFVPDVDGASYEPKILEQPDSRLGGTQILFKRLYKCMREAGVRADKGDTLFFIHGFGYSWASSVRHLQRLHDLYVAPPTSPIARIVFLTWPSYGSYFRYPSDQENARDAGLILGRMFPKVVRFFREFFSGRGKNAPDPFCRRKVHIASHSMGNQVLEAMFGAIREHSSLRVPIFGEVALLNADADWTALEPGRPLHELPEYAERVHVYNHHSDDALTVSETTKNERKRLGKHGPKDLRRLPPRTLVVDCSDVRPGQTVPTGDPFLTAAQDALGSKKTGYKELIVDHWGYLYRPEVMADLQRVFRGVSTSRLTADPDADGWVFRRERRGETLFRLLDV